MLTPHPPLRRRHVALLLALVASTGLACSSDSATAVPSPLDAFLTTSTLPVTPSGVDISGAGDSVIVTLVEANTCGYDESATASQLNGTLDVSVVLSAEDVTLCDPISGSTQYRIQVIDVPAGTYNVVAHFRSEIGTQINDAIVGSRTLVLP